MVCKALILGIVHKKNKPDSEKKFDFHLVSYVDTEDPAGASSEMSLGKDDDPTAFEKCRMKVVPVHVFQRGKYTNFGGFASGNA